MRSAFTACCSASHKLHGRLFLWDVKILETKKYVKKTNNSEPMKHQKNVIRYLKYFISTNFFSSAEKTTCVRLSSVLSKHDFVEKILYYVEQLFKFINRIYDDLTVEIVPFFTRLGSAVTPNFLQIRLFISHLR